jgi:hypothetical protein
MAYIGVADASVYFGAVVAINAAGDRIAMGMPFGDIGASNSGTVYVVHSDNGLFPGTGGGAGTLNLITTFCNAAFSGSGSTQTMGWSLSFNAAGDRLAIGGGGTLTTYNGWVWLVDFNYLTRLWPGGATGVALSSSNSFIYKAESTTNSNNFGRSISLNAKGDRLAVGAYVWNNTYVGAVYIIDYDYTIGNWPGTNGIAITSADWTRRYNPPTSEEPRYGRGVALNAVGDRLIVGAPAYDTTLTDTGAIYVYDQVDGIWPSDINGYSYLYEGAAAGDFLGGCVAINAVGDRFAGGAVHIGTFDGLTAITSIIGAADTYGSNAGYVALFSYNTPLGIKECRALANTNGVTLAGGKGTQNIFATSNDGITWTNSVNEGRPLYSGGQGYGLVQAFLGTIPQVAEQFGFSIALNAAGDRLVVGAVANTTNDGKVYCYNYVSEQGWIPDGYTPALNNVADENFGYCLTLNAAGDRLVVGANVNSSGSGKVYSYNYVSGQGWILTQSFNGVSGESNFGQTVALNAAGDRLVVAAYFSIKGRLYCYNYTGTQWIPDPYTPIITNGINEYLGKSFVLNAAGDRLVVGAYLNSTSVQSTALGKVYYYNYISGQGWILKQSLVGLVAGDNLGFSIALNATGERLVVGACCFIYDALINGKVYCYNYVNGQWVADTNTPTRSADGSLEQFGYSVALNAAGDRLVVGAVCNDIGATNAGKVYSYNYVSGSGWTADTLASFQGTNIYNTPLVGEQFGYSVALNAPGDRLAVGAYVNNSGVASGGRVYFFQEKLNTRFCNAVAGNANLFVAGGGPTTSGSSTLAWSDDSGASWNNSYNGTSIYPFAGGICYAVGWNGSKWIAGGLGTNPLAYSFDGKTWQQSSNGASLFTQINGVTWNGTYWLAVGVNSGTARIAYSSNGITWTAIPTSYSINTPKAIAGRRVTPNTGGNGGDVVADRLSAAALAQTFGFSQQWYDVTAQRALGVTYSNTTGKPIMVNVSVTLNNADTGIYVNNILVSRSFYTFNQVAVLLTAIVPPNGTYALIQITLNPPTIPNWAELR